MIEIPVVLNKAVFTNKDGAPNVTNADTVAITMVIPSYAVPGTVFKIEVDEYADPPTMRWAKLSLTKFDMAGATPEMSVVRRMQVQGGATPDPTYLVVTPGATCYLNLLSHNPARMPPPNVHNTNMIIDYRN